MWDKKAVVPGGWHDRQRFGISQGGGWDEPAAIGWTRLNRARLL